MSEFKQEVKKIVKEDSGLSFIKVVGTALTAITVSLISSRLMGTIHTVIVVGILSICTAVINEVYRVCLQFSHLATKKVVGKPITEDSPADSEDEPSTESSTSTLRLRSWAKITALFFAICLFTLGISYIVALNVGKHEVVENYQVVEQKEITDLDKNAIVDTATEKVSPQIKVLQNEISKLQKDLDNAKQENLNYSRQVENLTKEQLALKNKLDKIEQKPKESPTTAKPLEQNENKTNKNLEQ